MKFVNGQKYTLSNGAIAVVAGTFVSEGTLYISLSLEADAIVKTNYFNKRGDCMWFKYDGTCPGYPRLRAYFQPQYVDYGLECEDY